MSIAAYRAVLTRPGVAKLLGLGVLARVPLAAASVVMTLHVVTGLGRGYGAAGLVAASLTIGLAVGAPWRGRVVDRRGLRRALIPSIFAEAALWWSAPFLGYHTLLVVVFVGGVFGLPVFSVVRQSLAVLVPEENRRAAFALDSMSVELTFMIGPAAGVLLATQGSTDLALVAVGASMVVAGLALVLLDPQVRTSEGEAAVTPEPPPVPGAVVPPAAPAGDTGPAVPGARWWRPAWFGPRPALVLAVTFGTLVVLGGTDVAVIAHLRAHDDMSVATLVFVSWSVASLLGGLVFGAVSRPVSSSRLLLVMAVATVPIGLAPSGLWLAVAIFVPGLLCAPVLSATAVAITGLVPEATRGEAMGWYGSAMTVGMAAGAPLAGAAADLVGSWGGFAAVGVLGMVIGGVALSSPWVPGPVGTVRGDEAAHDRPDDHLAVPVGADD